MFTIFKLVWTLEVSILISILEETTLRYMHFYRHSKSRGAVNRAVRSLSAQGMIGKDLEGNYRCTERGSEVAHLLKELRFITEDVKVG